MKTHAELLGQLLPPVSYNPNEPRLATELRAEAKVLDRVLADANVVLSAITPYGAGQFPPDWERVYGIAPQADETLQQRLSTVVAKVNETGGMSIPYFKQLAAALGYQIDIEEPEPFCVDSNGIGDEIWIEDILWEWGVIVHGPPSLSYLFRVDESAVGEPLSTYADPILEQVFIDLKPADTYVYFVYLDA